jgi:hypothetical protein
MLLITTKLLLCHIHLSWSVTSALQLVIFLVQSSIIDYGVCTNEKNIDVKSMGSKESNDSFSSQFQISELN